MHTLTGEDPQFAKWLSYGLIASCILHGMLFLLAQSKLAFPRAAPEIIEVSLVSFPPPESTSNAKRQIVTEPDSKETKIPPTNAKFEAEKNRIAQREQIHRGDGSDAGRTIGENPPSPGSMKQPTSQTPASQAASRSKLPRESSQQSRSKTIQSLRLSPETLHGEFGVESQQKEAGPPARELLKSPSGLIGYQPFSRPVGSGARFLGQAGAADHLPSLPDGDITLLNAKANKFAVFVRRVATRVFSNLRASGWETLSSYDISRMHYYSTVHAVLSPEGKLLSVKLESPSGSGQFDDVLHGAVKNGATDPHPPPGAEAADGNIHFIFKARSWSQIGPSRGGKGVAEQRWLLLATGLG